MAPILNKQFIYIFFLLHDVIFGILISVSLSIKFWDNIILLNNNIILNNSIILNNNIILNHTILRIYNPKFINNCKSKQYYYYY